jgi:hypothetical protein
MITSGDVDSTSSVAGQITSPHVKYIAVVKLGKKFPEKHRDYSLEEDLG